MKLPVSIAALLLAAAGLSADGQEEATAISQPAAAAAETGPAEGGSTTLPDIVPGEVFVNANAAYEAGDHAQAVGLYQTLLRHGYEDGHLHYNLGNAYLRGGELGRAIAAYRRGQVFLPRDQDLSANLEFARKSTKDAIGPPDPGPVLSTLFFWHYSLSRAELALALVMFNVLLWSVLVLRIYRRGSEILRWVFMVLLLLVLGAAGSLAVHHLMPVEIAVIVPQEIDVRSGTSLQDVVLFKLHAGTEVRVVDRREGALRIALPGDSRGGWIAAEHAELVGL